MGNGFVGRGIAPVVVALLALVVGAPAAAAGPGEDSVVGTGTASFYGSFTIEAHSGPSGESPIGSVSARGSVTFDGPVTCLVVAGNVATMNIATSQFGTVTMEVTDSVTGPDVIEAIPTGRAPADCSPLGSGVVGVVTSGDIAVVDVDPLPVPGTLRDCLDGGWRDLFDATGQPFPNQGQCVRFAVHRAEGAVAGSISQTSNVDYGASPIVVATEGVLRLVGFGDAPLTARYEFVPCSAGYCSSGTLTAELQGGTITFDVDGTATPPSLSVGGTSSLTTTYTVTEGTGRFGRTTGTLVATGTATITSIDLVGSTFVSEDVLTITGELELRS